MHKSFKINDCIPRKMETLNGLQRFRPFPKRGIFHVQRVRKKTMKLMLKHEDDLTVPVAICQLCDREIDDAEGAMLFWRLEDAPAEGYWNPLLAHKRCMAANRAFDDEYVGSMELETFMEFLLQNVGMGMG
jgi:hypothetical protein